MKVMANSCIKEVDKLIIERKKNGNRKRIAAFTRERERERENVATRKRKNGKGEKETKQTSGCYI